MKLYNGAHVMVKTTAAESPKPRGLLQSCFILLTLIFSILCVTLLSDASGVEVGPSPFLDLKRFQLGWRRVVSCAQSTQELIVEGNNAAQSCPPVTDHPLKSS